MASQLPEHPAQFHDVPPTNNGMPSNRFISPHLPSLPPPRPPGLPNSRLVDRPQPVGASIPDGGPLQRRMPGLKTVSPWKLLLIAVAGLVTVLVFKYDPLVSIIDIEDAKRHASIENATLAFEKEKTERERKVMVHERELWEKARDAHLPRGAFWDVVWPAWDCLAYGKREYWGGLRNIPKDWDGIDACMNMPVEIKGVKIRRPDRCALAFGKEYRVQGYWVVDWDQPDCKPWYRDFEDKWCTSYNSGKRRIEAQIVGINDKGGQDWCLLCNSTPLVWDMITYASPTRCEERPWGKKVAVWDVPDESCLS